MRSQRNDWLSSLSKAEFAGLDPWIFINDEESRKQWVAEVRKRLRTSMPDEEIHSILCVGLHDAVSSAIRNHADTPPESRGLCLFGYALQFIRRKGIAKVFDEIPGSSTVSLTSIDACSQGRRSHMIQGDYYEAAMTYEEALEVSPVFLSDGVLLNDASIQAQHNFIEQIRCLLTQREHQILRLLVIEEQKPSVISEMLQMSTKQVAKIRRNLKTKLCSIAIETGVCAELAMSLTRSSKQ